MKAKIIIIENIDEIVKAEIEHEKQIDNMGTSHVVVPVENKVPKDFYFNINDVLLAYIGNTGNIFLNINNEYFEIEYCEELIEKLESKF